MKMFDKHSTDSDLWIAIKCNDQNAFKLLFDRYWGRLYTTARTYLKDGEVSEALVHDIFLNIWIKRDQLNILNLKNYLTSATRYHVYKELKIKKTARIVYTEECIEFNASFAVNQAEEKFSAQTLKKQLGYYLGSLPRRCKEVYLLSREEQLSNQEIANRLNISKRSVENQITHALQHLRVNIKNLLILVVTVLFN